MHCLALRWTTLTMQPSDCYITMHEVDFYPQVTRCGFLASCLRIGASHCHPFGYSDFALRLPVSIVAHSFNLKPLKPLEVHILFVATISADFIQRTSFNQSIIAMYPSNSSAYNPFSTASPSNSFSMLADSHSPRDMHTTYEEFGHILNSFNGHQSLSLKKNSITSGLKKLFGGM